MKTILSSLLFISFTFANDVKVVGKGLLEYSIFRIDIYHVTYLNNEDLSKETIVLDYKIDVKKEYSVEGWQEGLKYELLKNPQYKEDAKWLYNQSVDLKAGDKLKIIRENDTVSIYKNEILLAKTTNKNISKIVFSPWIGDQPVDLELKKKLLNIN
jgi:hypothetical protein